MANAPRKAAAVSTPASEEKTTTAPTPVVVETPATIPDPTQVKLMWFPAIVQLPGEAEASMRNAKVYATPEGVFIYTEVPAGESTTPNWYGAVDYETAPKPPIGWQARNGFTIPTDKGTLVVTLDGGCGCGSPLKRWTPQFAKRATTW